MAPFSRPEIDSFALRTDRNDSFSLQKRIKLFKTDQNTSPVAGSRGREGAVKHNADALGSDCQA
jgi:hypothetical protein